MKKDVSDRGLGLVVLGFLMGFAARAWAIGLPLEMPWKGVLYYSMILGGVVSAVVGCGYVARARGRSVLWGVLGLLSFIGLAAILMIPVRLKGPCSEESTVQREPGA